MVVSRRDFLRATSAVAAALGLGAAGLLRLRESLGLPAANGGVPVVWLAAQACTGCSVSLLNTINITTIDDLLVNKLDVKFHPQLSAAAGAQAVAAITAAQATPGYVLVVEGAVPIGANGKYCMVWPNTTAQQAVTALAANAGYIIAAGTCASFGGMSGGNPNPTAAKGLSKVLAGKTVVNVPGCPVHPDWLVGTIAYVLANGKAPPLDSLGRPTAFYGRTVHDQCPYLTSYDRSYGRIGHNGGRNCLSCHTNTDRSVPAPRVLSQSGCLFALGCRGKATHCDCSVRKWNGGAANSPGVNWCVDAGSPCIGCTEPTFPDSFAPFYTLSGSGAEGDDGEGGGD